MATSFNPHQNVTADGHLVQVGLIVWNYDYEECTVIGDDYAISDYRCCARTDHSTAQKRLNGSWMIDHMPTGCEGSCGHDHWFRVETANGTKTFNGERLSVRKPC